MVEEGEVVSVKKGQFSDSVDRFLDASPDFAASLRQVFLQVVAAASPSSAASPSPLLPASSFIPALNTLLQRLTEGVDPKLWRLSLRRFTYCDIEGLVKSKPTFDPYQPLGFTDFEWATRQAFKNMAMERSRRVGFYILGGIVVVHLLHGLVRKVPYIGKHVGLVVSILSPTPIMGPLLGFAGASFWEDEKIFNKLLSL